MSLDDVLSQSKPTLDVGELLLQGLCREDVIIILVSIRCARFLRFRGVRSASPDLCVLISLEWPD